MSDSKPCRKCGRTIDPYAKSCPFCNWDQTVAPPPTAIQPDAAGTTTVPPSANDQIWRRRVLVSGALVTLIIAAFVVGVLFHRHETPAMTAAGERNESRSRVAESRTPRSDVTLVPVTDTAMFEQPITSTPAVTASTGSSPTEQRNDATALPSSEYAAVAERAKAERVQKGLVDPRSISGSVFNGGIPGSPPPPRRANPPMASSAMPTPHPRRTAPIPEFQPVPNLHVDRNTTARLTLTVGADGTVKDVDIAQSIPGQTPNLIAAVQRWRFRPATENGVPVEGRFSVDISFHGNE